MSETEHGINHPETQSETPWYFDDEKLTELYQLMDNNEISNEDLRKHYDEVQEKLTNLFSLSEDVRTREDEAKIEMLNNIARALFKKVGPKETIPTKSETHDDAIDLGDTAH